MREWIGSSKILIELNNLWNEDPLKMGIQFLMILFFYSLNCLTTIVCKPKAEIKANKSIFLAT